MRKNLMVRRAAYLFGLVLAIPILALTLLGGSYGILVEEVPRLYQEAKIIYGALEVGVSGVSVLDMVSSVFSLLLTGAIGTAIGALGLWLPYHTLFGKHESRWPK